MSWARGLIIVGLIAVAIAVPAAVWLGGSDSGSNGVQSEPSRTDTTATRFVEMRREGLTHSLDGMRAHGAGPDQIANVESQLGALDG